MRILLVTQMWPSPENPDLGSFLVPLARELEAAGHEVDVAAISRRGGPPNKYAQLTRTALVAARRRRPDVVFAHFLFPAGAAGALAATASRAPMVVMAHGQDVANLGRIPGVTTATRWIVRRAAAIIANSRWLADRLVDRIPATRARLEIASCGVDLDAFAPRPAAAARQELGWEGDGPAYLCVGSLIERKNVVRLADAFERVGRGRLAFVGDGPLRSALEGRANVRVTGRIPQAEVPRWIAACDVLCQPSLVEPFGQATLEGMAMERSVIATVVGGPPEFVPDEAGVLVDPRDTDAVAAALERAAELPSPNPGARKAAEEHDVRRQAARMAAILERAVDGNVEIRRPRSST
jgi:glycosyltransferase involved in cell wall biosynthesis